MKRDYLQLFRATTYPSTMLPVVGVYLFNNAPNLTALLLIVLTIPLHYFSFGLNSLLDYHEDVKDPNKQHHPLITGRIKLDTASNVVNTGAILIGLAFAIVTLILGDNIPLALASFFMYTVLGYAYDTGLNKSTIYSWLPISLCFTALAAYGWFMGHTSFGIIPALILLYVFLDGTYEIAFGGSVKDLEADRNNILKKLGVTLSNNELKLGRTVGIWYTMASLKFIVLLLFIWYTHIGLVSETIGILFGILALYFTSRQTRQTVRMSHGKLILNISLIEICTIYALLFSAVALPWAILLGLYGIVYFFLSNRTAWGVWYPAV